MTVMGVPRFERFFRLAAGLRVDKDDLKAYSDFINRKLYDMLLMAQATAKANQRDVVEPYDLPVTKGLQESIHKFEELDADIELEPVLEQLEALPPLDLVLSEETEPRLPPLVGAMSLALARTMRIIDPGLKEPHSVHWDRGFQIFETLL
jgi:hypothetical protein